MQRRGGERGGGRGGRREGPKKIISYVFLYIDSAAEITKVFREERRGKFVEFSTTVGGKREVLCTAWRK